MASVTEVRFRKTFTSAQLTIWLQAKFREEKEPQLKAKQAKNWKGKLGRGHFTKET
jgi:hypothetical protein